MKIAGLASLVALALVAPAQAATITVTTTEDAPPPGCSAERCSLRQALAAAAPGDEIRVPASPDPYALRADLGQLVVTQPGVRILGGDTRRTLLGGGGATRVLAVASGIREVTVSGVTITGGAATADVRGGGISIAPRAELTLRDVAVVANAAGAGSLAGLGGGIYNAGTLVLERVLVADNLAGGTGIAFGRGGGIFNVGSLRAESVTIARNTAGGALALSSGGGVYTASPGISRLHNATVSANRAAVLGSGANLYSEAARAELRNTIVLGAIGTSSCGGGVTSLGHNLEDRTGCGLGGPRDLRLGPLRDNGGPTNTRMPEPGSPAIDAGADCAPTDQRGFARPRGACDIGAAERDGTPTGTAPPQRGATVAISPASGRVLYRVPGAPHFVSLTAPQQVPLGTLVDTERGVVTLTATRDDAGTVDQANFFDGTFAVTQQADGAGRSLTVLTLRGTGLSDCAAQPGAGAAQSKGKRKRKRRLWGSGKGNFRTKGRHSSATVRGTRWLTEDTCDGTLTRVREGVVDVEDDATGKRVRLRAGSSYVARPYRCTSRRRFRISVPVSRALRVRRATAVVGGRRVRLHREGRRVTGIIDLRGLRRGTFSVRVTIVFADGDTLREGRTYRTCRP